MATQSVLPPALIATQHTPTVQDARRGRAQVEARIPSDDLTGELRFECIADEACFGDWSKFVRHRGGAGWGQIPAIAASYREYGARPYVHVGRTARGDIVCGALILVFQPLPVPIRFGLCLGGPVTSPAHLRRLLEHVRSWGKRLALTHVVLSPASTTFDCDLPGVRRGATFAPVRYTRQGLVVDIQRTDDELLKSFRSGTRRDIRYALRAPQRFDRITSPREAVDVAGWMHAIHVAQSVPVRARSAFMRFAEELVADGDGEVFTVRSDAGVIAAGLFVVAGNTMWYISGAIDRAAESRRYPAHLLHFCAMTYARDIGLARYDFTTRSTPSVYAFKRGFRPTEYDTAGEFELPIIGPLYLGMKMIGPWANKYRRSIGDYIAKLATLRNRASR